MTLTAELAGLSILNLDIKALVDAFGAPMAAAVQLANIAVVPVPAALWVRFGFGSFRLVKAEAARLSPPQRVIQKPIPVMGFLPGVHFKHDP